MFTIDKNISLKDFIFKLEETFPSPSQKTLFYL
jgi:hypothetical protein